MKKILVFLALFTTTVACNAAAVIWNSGVVYKASDISTTVGKGATDYLVTISIFSDASGKTAVSGLTGDFSSNTAKIGSAYSGTVEGLTLATKYYIQMVITTEGYEAKSSIVSFTTVGTGDTTLNFAKGTGFDDTSYTFNTNKSGTWQAVPEPTSGLLMLLGAAGLALKRKRI